MNSNINNPFEEQFRQLYSSLDLKSDGNDCRPMHKYCACAKKCWVSPPKESDNIYQNFKSDRWDISRPWVGQEYDRSRLMILGINFNDDGGYDELNNLFKEAQNEMPARKWVFRNKDNHYGGTLFYHRMGCYAASFLMALGIINIKYENDHVPDVASILNAYNYMSFTNHIKCAPWNKARSRPTKVMWENCGRHILQREIDILQPKYIFVLGRTDNAYYFRDKVADVGSEDWHCSNDIGRNRINWAKLRIGGRSTLVVVFPHPSYSASLSKVLENMQESINIQ